MRFVKWTKKWTLESTHFSNTSVSRLAEMSSEDMTPFTHCHASYSLFTPFYLNSKKLINLQFFSYFPALFLVQSSFSLQFNFFLESQRWVIVVEWKIWFNRNHPFSFLGQSIKNENFLFVKRIFPCASRLLSLDVHLTCRWN